MTGRRSKRSAGIGWLRPLPPVTYRATKNSLVLSILRQETTQLSGGRCKRFAPALDPDDLNTVRASLRPAEF